MDGDEGGGNETSPRPWKTPDSAWGVLGVGFDFRALGLGLV